MGNAIFDIENKRDQNIEINLITCGCKLKTKNPF